MTDAPGAVSAEATVQALLADPGRLGLTWDLRPGTVTNAAPLTVLVDGDDKEITMTSMIGVVDVSMRVFTLAVPPSGNFVCGFANDTAGRLATVSNKVVAGPVAQTRNTNVYADVLISVGVPFRVTLPKKFEATGLRIDCSGTFYTSVGTASGPLFGVIVTGVSGSDANVNGFNNIVGHLGIANPSASNRVAWSGHTVLRDIGKGTAVCTLQWQRFAGTGTLAIDTGDAIFMTVSEVWPS